jgi:hypothetical protein
MIVKDIQMNYSNSEEIQYNKAEVLELYKTGDVRCNVLFKEEGQELRRDTNIIFFADNLPFELSEEEVEILRPIIDTEE